MLSYISQFIGWIMLLVFSQTPLWSQSIDSLKQQLSIEKDKGQQIIINNDLSWEYLYVNIDSALFYANQALMLANNYQSEQHLATSLQMTALVYEVSGKFEEAVEHYIASIEINKKIDNHNGVASAYNNLGVLFYVRGNNEKALDYFTKSMEYEKRLGNRLGQGECLVNIGTIESAKGQIEQAKNTFLEAYAIFQELENKRLIPRASINLYNMYKKLGDLDLAESYLQESIRLYEETNDVSGMATANSEMGELLIEKGQYIPAIVFLDKAEQQALGLGKVYELSNVYRIISDSWKKMGNYEKALDYKEKYLVMHDSITNLDHSQMIEQLEANFRSAEQKQRITELELQKREADLHIQKVIVRQILLAAVLVVILVIMVLIYWRYRTGQKLNTLLSQKNDIISKSLKEKEMLMREIHHRVKNNLQVISSLLNLQSHFITDEKANAAVLESKNRVQSMSLIHQSLYAKDNITEVNSEEYINQLLDNLEKSYQNKEQNISIYRQIDAHPLDVDEAVPLGLIINEIVTNAYKHAFTDMHNGGITVLFTKRKGEFVLEIKDNGKGNQGKPLHRDKSLGMILIEELSEKLRAEVFSDTLNGVKFKLFFKSRKEKEAA